MLLTHPVQYYAPLFRELAGRAEVELTVLYAHRPTPDEQGAGFGVPFLWDVDLTGGYNHRWLRNRVVAPSASSFYGTNTPEVGEVIDEGEFDVFVVFGWHSLTYWQAMWACWKRGIPVLVRGDSTLNAPAVNGVAAARHALKSLVKRATYPWFIRRFSVCLSVGVRSEEYFRFYGARHIVRSPHFVENEVFARAAEAASARTDLIRRDWEIPGEMGVVLFAGKLIPRKRPLDLIRAAASIQQKVCILFAGDGELREDCDRVAKGLGVIARFTGFLNQTQIPAAYAIADVLVLPSSVDTWGLVVNEAMACGVAAIVADAVGCAPDLVVPGVTGYTFRTGDTEALAAVMGALLSTPGAAAQFGKAARNRVAAYTASAAADGILAAVRLSVDEYS